jgi:hypothetical protein
VGKDLEERKILFSFAAGKGSNFLPMKVWDEF